MKKQRGKTFAFIVFNSIEERDAGKSAIEKMEVAGKRLTCKDVERRSSIERRRTCKRNGQVRSERGTRIWVEKMRNGERSRKSSRQWRVRFSIAACNTTRQDDERHRGSVVECAIRRADISEGERDAPGSEALQSANQPKRP